MTLEDYSGTNGPKDDASGRSRGRDWPGARKGHFKMARPRQELPLVVAGHAK